MRGGAAAVPDGEAPPPIVYPCRGGVVVGGGSYVWMFQVTHARTGWRGGWWLVGWLHERRKDAAGNGNPYA